MTGKVKGGDERGREIREKLLLSARGRIAEFGHLGEAVLND
jgi:hypothetical protein